MKNIVLLCECEFTRLGLETLMQPEARIFSTTDLEQCRAHLSRSLRGIDLVVLSVRSGSINALVRLATLIRVHHPACRVLMDPGAASIPLLRFYLNCLNTTVGLIDFTQPVPALRHFLGEVMRSEKVLPAKKAIHSEQLSYRERNILQEVMRGVRPKDIAKTLKLSDKTISHYKRTGLRKLGARNIQDLLMPVACRYPHASDAIRAQDIYNVLPCQYAVCQDQDRVSSVLVGA